MNSLLLTDSYKLGHADQYPENTSLVFSNFTPRSDGHAPESLKNNGVVVFGVQLMLRQLAEHFDKNFFQTDSRYSQFIIDNSKGYAKSVMLQENNKIREKVIKDLKSYLDIFTQTDFNTSRFEELWDLGYLPIEVRALDEGSLCPIRVPMLTIHNTLPEFFWITNYLETIISTMLWKPITSATIAHGYKKLLVGWALKTDPDNIDFTNWQGHDFSSRGLDATDAIISSGLGHLTSFWGTDSLATLWGARHFYDEKEFLAGSVPATEHSVMCAGSKEGEKETFLRLLETYPTGPLSVVSDTWDFWKVLTETLPEIKEQIMSRDGKLIIRPDSGDPVDIICGTLNNYRDISKYFPEGEILPEYFEDYLIGEVQDETPHGEMGPDEYEQTYIVRGKLYTVNIDNISWNRYDKQYYFVDMYEKANITFKEDQILPEHKGAVEILWDIFGGTVNEQGYKVLDSHIGLIYGDSITLERGREICKRLEAKGFATTNVVLGIGSFTYQFNTRDTFGFAMKATYIEKATLITDCDEVGAKACVDSCQGDCQRVEYEGIEIFKDPKTDSGLKKSAKGLLKVIQGENGLELVDQISWEELRAEDNLLTPVYVDGKFMKETTMTEIRERVNQLV